MEIERKFLIESCPLDLSEYAFLDMEQGYLCTEPVVRIRKENEEYFLTYKSKGLLEREEYNLPLTKDAYLHMRKKVDGRLISKRRYLIPTTNSLTVELDVFQGDFYPLMLAEVEFKSKEDALSYQPLEWFGREVTYESAYYNSTLSQKNDLANND